MNELVELQLTMTAIADSLTADPREIPSYADLSENAAGLTIEAAVELAKRRAKVANESEKELAQTRGNIRREASKALFEAIIADPKPGDFWENSVHRYTVETVERAKKAPYPFFIQAEGGLVVIKTWKFWDVERIFPAGTEEILREFRPEMVAYITIIRRAS